MFSGQGKFEHLIVAAQEIAASTAQLYVSSRVKADSASQKLVSLNPQKLDRSVFFSSLLQEKYLRKSISSSK